MTLFLAVVWAEKSDSDEFEESDWRLVGVAFPLVPRA